MTQATDHFIVRQAAPLDLDGMVDLVENCFAADDNQRLLGKRVLRTIFDLLLASGKSLFLVVEADRRVAGFIWVQFTRLSPWRLVVFSPIRSLKLAYALARERKVAVLKRIGSEGGYSGGTVVSPRIVSLAVEEPFRKKGVGRLLVEESLRRLGAQGESSCFVATASQNEAAINFYRKNGFAVLDDGEKQMMFERKISTSDQAGAGKGV